MKTILVWHCEFDSDALDSQEPDEYEYSFTSSGDDDGSSSSDSDGDDDSDDEKEEDEALSLWVGAWNVGESGFVLDGDILRKWLGNNARDHYAALSMHDVYVVGLQECVSQHRKQWINGILGYLDNGKKQFVVLQKVHLMNILIVVIVNRLYEDRIRDIKCKSVACGTGNIIGIFVCYFLLSICLKVPWSKMFVIWSN